MFGRKRRQVMSGMRVLSFGESETDALRRRVHELELAVSSLKQQRRRDELERAGCLDVGLALTQWEEAERYRYPGCNGVHLSFYGKTTVDVLRELHPALFPTVEPPKRA